MKWFFAVLGIFFFSSGSFSESGETTFITPRGFTTDITQAEEIVIHFPKRTRIMKDQNPWVLPNPFSPRDRWPPTWESGKLNKDSNLLNMLEVCQRLGAPFININRKQHITQALIGITPKFITDKYPTPPYKLHRIWRCANNDTKCFLKCPFKWSKRVKGGWAVDDRSPSYYISISK